MQRTPVRLLAYCLLSNHWHLLLWPRADGELSEFMRWLTLTHTQRWHANRHTSGTGPIYQGRFKSFPVQSDEHLLTVARYIERNPLRAGMVEHVEQWQWSSLCVAARQTRRSAKFLATGRWRSRGTGRGGCSNRRLRPNCRPFAAALYGPAVWRGQLGASCCQAIRPGVHVSFSRPTTEDGSTMNFSNNRLPTPLSMCIRWYNVNDTFEFQNGWAAATPGQGYAVYSLDGDGAFGRWDGHLPPPFPA